MKLWTGIALFTIGLVVSGCSSGSSDAGTNTTSNTPTAGKPTEGGSKKLVVFAQANSQDPWRQVFDADTKAAAGKLSAEFSFEEQDASDDASKQIDVINTFMVKKPAVLIVSPVEKSVGAAIEKAFDGGTPVILLDRGIESEKYTAYIGGDNTEIGRQAGEFIAQQLKGKGTVLMFQGIADATPTANRRDGAMESFKKYPGITVIPGDDCKYQRQAARSFMETFLQKKIPFDAVYAHNDEMAIGAYLAMEAAKTPKKIIVGIDGCQKEVVDYIKEGKLDATFKYPCPGPAGIELAAKLIKGEKPAQKKIILQTEKVTKENADAYLTANPNLAK